MARRWTVKEQHALDEVRRRLKDQLSNRPQFPEVVGDRRLLRFLRGNRMKIDESVKMISAFLKWRDDNRVDDVRQDIVYGGKDTPFKFPFGKIIIDLAPQIIISANSLDKKGRPLAMETFDFSPNDVLNAISIADYLVFLTYTLEYRTLVLEQMSHEREQKYLAENPEPQDGYGVILLDYTIRDLKGVGFAHLGAKGRALVGAALELGLPNYQEFLGKCVMVNTPWVFNTFWYFVKGLLDEDTIAKINLCGGNYLPTLLEDMTIENIPECLGGKFKLYNEPFEFDRSVGGPLWAGDPLDTSPQPSEPARRGSGRPPLSTGLRVDTTMSPLSMSSGLTSSPLSPGQDAQEQSVFRSVASTDRGTTSNSSSTSDLSSVTVSDKRHVSAKPGAVASARTASAAPSTRTASQSLFQSIIKRPGVAEREDSASTVSTLDAEGHTAPTPKLNSQALSRLPHQTQSSRTEAHIYGHGHGVGGVSAHGHGEDGGGGNTMHTSHLSMASIASLDSMPSTPATPHQSPSKPWLVVVVCSAVWAEFCEFCGSLYTVLTHYPLRTLIAGATIGILLYLRIEGKLHLLVVPVLLLVTMLYFELLR